MSICNIRSLPCLDYLVRRSKVFAIMNRGLYTCFYWSHVVIVLKNRVGEEHYDAESSRLCSLALSPVSDSPRCGLDTFDVQAGTRRVRRQSVCLTSVPLQSQCMHRAISIVRGDNSSQV
jgi:hypothetical protein